MLSSLSAFRWLTLALRWTDGESTSARSTTCCARAKITRVAGEPNSGDRCDCRDAVQHDEGGQGLRAANATCWNWGRTGARSSARACDQIHGSNDADLTGRAGATSTVGARADPGRRGVNWRERLKLAFASCANRQVRHSGGSPRLAIRVDQTAIQVQVELVVVDRNQR
jgi:hypothetical protein